MAGAETVGRRRNKARGEVEIQVGGKTVCVAMTLGVLAEMETALQITDFDELSAKLSSPTPKMLLLLMRCILTGNGIEYDEAMLLKMQIPDVMRALTEMMALASFNGEEDGAEADAGNGQAQMLL